MHSSWDLVTIGNKQGCLWQHCDFLVQIPSPNFFLSWQLKQMLQITSYVIAERKSPNWPFLLLILLPKTTLILWYKSYHQTFPELIIVDVTPYFICNCWTQVTKLVTSTAYFVAKNFSTHYSPQNGQKKVVKLASLATYLVANFFFFLNSLCPPKWLQLETLIYAPTLYFCPCIEFATRWVTLPLNSLRILPPIWCTRLHNLPSSSFFLNPVKQMIRLLMTVQ